ncbi:hypothetical protein CUMW_139970 [Citrus unshiu]|nr:hypothetical protein CUMW_139970 [Citrus unshiu]
MVDEVTQLKMFSQVTWWVLLQFYYNLVCHQVRSYTSVVSHPLTQNLIFNKHSNLSGLTKGSRNLDIKIRHEPQLMQGAQQPECSDLDHNKDKIKSETARIKTNSIDSTQELESQLIPSN